MYWAKSESPSNSVIFHFNIPDHYFAKWTSIRSYKFPQYSIQKIHLFISRVGDRGRGREVYLLVAIKLQPHTYSIESKTYYRFTMGYKEKIVISMRGCSWFPWIRCVLHFESTSYSNMSPSKFFRSLNITWCINFFPRNGIAPKWVLRPTTQLNSTQLNSTQLYSI